ncbi:MULTISPECIES: SPOR domain-containing protein [unclassified Sphingomonas]|uniref:SPOR domain-containing protein n=1 Tax=unclassified Sphingomonas TaxID=196159 RepID=UPI001D11D560|nr:MULTISPECIES: SPOR domain-containing protein [unclassified Sphingomonas]MCC2979168.1 SPOR domain-containing protein [Sphingomonas sp. IC4-52]MCD2315598.1 SPOR domain-containing protein [Sphingomonas sp. IC-11]
MASNEIDLRDEDRLPWLETVEADEPEGPGLFRVVVLVVVGLVLLAAIVFAVLTFQQRAPDGQGELIAAPAGDYKVRPDDPGGLKVEGEGDSAIAVSAGANAPAAIDLKAVPETPIDGRRAEGAPAPVTGGSARTVAEVPGSGGRLTATAPMSAPTKPVPGMASGGSLVQLGAFPSEAAANAAWSAVAKRFSYVATLGKTVQSAEVNGRKVYRLKVNAGSADAAADLCGRLTVAGEKCFVTS